MQPFFMMSLLYLTAAVLAVALQAGFYAGLLPGVLHLNWLRVHLITVGTITMFAFGAAPALTAARLGAPPPSPAMTWAQWGLLNLGFLLLLVGMPGNAPWLASVGAGLIFVAVCLLLVSLAQMWHGAPGGQRASARFYLTAPVFLLIGILLALGLLLGWPAPGGRMGTLESHIHANIWGFVAFLVAGTLYEVLPRLVGRPLPHPNWVQPSYWALVTGLVGLISGPWLGLTYVTIAGLAVYVIGTVLLLANLVQTTVQALPDIPPAAGHLMLGYVWMIAPVFFAPFVMLVPESLPTAQVEAAALRGMVLGWILQMAMGGMPTVLHRLESSAPPHAETGSGWGWLAVLLVNVGVAISWIAGLLPPGPTSATGIAVGMGLVALGVLPFLARLWAMHTRRVSVHL